MAQFSADKKEYQYLKNTIIKNHSTAGCTFFFAHYAFLFFSFFMKLDYIFQQLQLNLSMP